ncbi:pentatricopeptide repeat-containing protein At5g15280, mitochondrial [Typha latifolia]|uniref:pentatricopeptide repeat-containing protein At5g15280, mitochondrial n=1 Tax=Typha latifolia TaxID=4733 RepID=UPI003C2DD655
MNRIVVSSFRWRTKAPKATKPFSTTPVPSFSEQARCNTRTDFVEKSYSGIGRSVISKCSYLWEKKADTFPHKSSLQDLLKLGLHLSPETIRPFWRVSALKPEDVLDVLLGFGSDAKNLRKVGFCWKLFNWAAEQSRDFNHLPRSYEIMASMLTEAEMLEDAESLLQISKCGFSDSSVLFSEIIHGYAKACNLEKSISLYDSARNRGLIPSASCYRTLLNLLISRGKSETVVKVYMDMLDAGLVSYSEEHIIDFVVEVLTKDGEIVRAMKILKQAKYFGIKVGTSALSAISEGFCKKKDFNDMMNFMEEWGYIPQAPLCNKMISSVCSNLGNKDAWLFVKRMEVLGFTPDAVTFAILICQSCRGGQLRDAFIYLSECFSRNLTPKVCAYNAIISGVFKEGLYRHARYVFDDMIDKGLMPDASTFRILLAGYCRHKKFDEVKQVLGMMKNNGEIALAPAADALSKALVFLGLDYLEVKIKRDNDPGLPKAEFFDTLGNGLFLETDIEKYEISLVRILDSAMAPDFDSVIRLECQKGHTETALQVKNEAVQWGQSISLSTYSELLKGLCVSPQHLKEAVSLIEEMPDLSYQLDTETFDFLTQKLTKNRMPVNVRLILERFFKRDLLAESSAYIDLLLVFCKEKNIIGFRECWESSKRGKCLLGRKDIMVLVSCLCKWGVIDEVLVILDGMVDYWPYLVPDACKALLKELCVTGYTSVGCAIVETFLERNLVLDHAAFVYLIKGFLKEQKFVEAVGIFDICLENNRSMSPDVYKLMLPLLFRYNKADKAISLMQDMQSKQLGADIHLQSILMDELCRTRKTKEVTVDLHDILIDKILVDDIDLDILLCGYCRENNLGKAYEVLGLMVRKNINLSVSAYRSLVQQMCMHRQLHAAFNLKDLIWEVSKSQELILCNILIFYLSQTGEVFLVKSILKNMHDRHIPLDRSTYDFLIYGFYKSGNMPMSVEALNTMITKGLTPSKCSLRIVINNFCNNGELDKALDISELIECRGWKHCSVIQNVLAVKLLSFGKLSEAEIVLERVNKREIFSTDINYGLLIKLFCLKGNTAKAVDLLNAMLKKGYLPSEGSYSLVIYRLCICRAFDQALDYLAEMQYENLKPSKESCDALIAGLCAVGKTDDAKRILRSILVSGSTPTYRMYTNVIDRYYANKNLNEVAELLHEMQQVGYSPNFEMQWSVISNLSSCNSKTDGSGEQFLSHLLSGCSLRTKNTKDRASPLFRHWTLRT